MKTSELKALVEKTLLEEKETRVIRGMPHYLLKKWTGDHTATAYICSNYVRNLGYNCRVITKEDGIYLYVARGLQKHRPGRWKK